MDTNLPLFKQQVIVLHIVHGGWREMCPDVGNKAKQKHLHQGQTGFILVHLSFQGLIHWTFEVRVVTFPTAVTQEVRISNHKSASDHNTVQCPRSYKRGVCVLKLRFIRVRVSQVEKKKRSSPESNTEP